MRKTTLAPGQLLRSVHTEKSYLGKKVKKRYLVLHNGNPPLEVAPGQGEIHVNSYRRQTMHRGKVDPGVSELPRGIQESCEQALKGCSLQVEVKSRKTKENGFSHTRETALIHRTGEILISKPTFIQGVSEKLLKSEEHKSPPVHAFIWRFSIF